MRLRQYDKSKTFVEDEQQELLVMTLDDFKATARAYLREDDMLYVVVGDRETQFDPVTAFAGVPVIELDIYGDPLE